MDDDLIWRYRRWHEADEHERDEEADAACMAVFTATREDRPVPVDFTSRTLAAIASATAAERRRVVRTRRAVVAGALAGVATGLYTGGSWLLGMLPALLVGIIDILVALTVRVATGVHAGTDIWTVLASLGRAAAAFVADPTVTIVILAMQGIAMAALLGLQRLLGSDRESLK
ncbi:hypothetical protein BH24ACI4_BH24ACI4_34050 [soil metagenome]